MDTSKIPWIECVITLPEQIENHFNKLISIYKKKSRTKKKLKKKINRITTENVLEFVPENNTEKIFTELALIANSSQKIPIKLENKIIDYIDFIIKKYMNIYIHSEDQKYLISEKNRDNNKIFLKFYFPKIKNEENDIMIENKINKFGDNIHFTLLPEIFEHGINGMFHLTFRIESKTRKPIYEYSKYISFNVVDDKVGIILYDDERGNNAVVFKISNNLQELNKLIASINNMSNGIDNTINTEVYKDICLYIALDIFKKLFDSKKIDNFFTRYLNSFGLETIYKMINKLISILLSTFLDLYNNK